MDSWTSRLTWLPSNNWQAQVSTGRIHQPEAFSTGDEDRTTVSLEYAEKARAASIIWGRDYKTAGHYAVNAITTEGVLPIARKDYVTGRFEWSQRDELFADQPQLASTLPRWFDISAYTVGYTRQVGRWHGTGIGIGANATAYAIQGRRYAWLHERGFDFYVEDAAGCEGRQEYPVRPDVEGIAPQTYAVGEV
jgi:hypothetical protein